MGVVSPLPGCLLPFLVSAVPPLSLCHLQLPWLWGKGLAGAPLCEPAPPPASPPTCQGSWGRCCPSSPCKSINLLGKHSQEREVCLSVHGAARGVLGSSGAMDSCWGARLASLGWGTALQNGPCLDRLWGCSSGAPEEPQGAGASRSSRGCWGPSCCFPPISSCHSAALPNPRVRAGSVQVWAGSLRLPARAARGRRLLLPLTPSHAAPQHPGALHLCQCQPVPPPLWPALGEPGQGPGAAR